MTSYKVTRPHLGDKSYKIGDIRQAKPNDVAHLVKNGVLVEIQNEPQEQKQTKASTRSTKVKPE